MSRLRKIAYGYDPREFGDESSKIPNGNCPICNKPATNVIEDVPYCGSEECKNEIVDLLS